MFHWESRKIQGRWVQAPQEWFVCVDCDKYGLDPYMLEGREITLNTRGVTAARRLGSYIDGSKKSQAYFRPWPDNVGDYLATETEQELLRGLRKAPVCEIGQRTFRLRQRLKDSAIREMRARSAILEKSPSVSAWQRWACERLDDTLLMMASERDDCTLPPNQFAYITEDDIAQALCGAISAAQSKRSNSKGRPDFWIVSEPL